MEYKPPKPEFSFPQNAHAAPEKRRGCGCFAIGCLVMFMGLCLLCVGSYYAIMHTSFPLSWIEQAIEESGEVRVEGLKGSISSGFEIDELKVISDDGENWNEFRNISFQFNGLFDLFRSQRLIIEEVSIGSAMVYDDHEFDELYNETPWIGLSWMVDVDSPDEDFRDTVDELRDNLNDNDMRELKEMRVDLISFRDFELVDPLSGNKLAIDRIELRGFAVEAGRVVSLGNVVVESDQIDLETESSSRWPDEPLAWRIRGALKPELNRDIKKAIDGTIDIALIGERVVYEGTCCDGAIRLVRADERSLMIELNQLNPDEYLDLHTQLAPSEWNMTVRRERTLPDSNREESDKEADSGDDAESDDDAAGREIDREAPGSALTVAIEDGGSFMLGSARFEIEPVTFNVISNDSPDFELQAQATVDGELVRATVRLLPAAPYVRVGMKSGEWNEKDLWAHLFFESKYNDLESDQQQEIDRAISGVPFRTPPVEQEDF